MPLPVILMLIAVALLVMLLGVALPFVATHLTRDTREDEEDVGWAGCFAHQLYQVIPGVGKKALPTLQLDLSHLKLVAPFVRVKATGHPAQHALTNCFGRG
jgi:hypothetical protein